MCDLFATHSEMLCVLCFVVCLFGLFVCDVFYVFVCCACETLCDDIWFALVLDL